MQRKRYNPAMQVAESYRKLVPPDVVVNYPRGSRVCDPFEVATGDAKMAALKVYRYDYYDPVLKRDRRSVDYATGDRIMELSGTILVETQQEVDEDMLEEDGTIRAVHVFMDPPVRPPRTRTRPEHRRTA